MNVIPLIQAIYKSLCFLNANHSLTDISTEDGDGRDFRYVESCMCGKRKQVGGWTNVIHPIGNEFQSKTG